MPAKVEAILAIGGNLGNRRQNIIDAAARLQSTTGIDMLAISPLVESAAMTPDGLEYFFLFIITRVVVILGR